MIWLLLYIAGVVVTAAVVQRVFIGEDILDSDDGLDVAMSWFIGTGVGALWPMVAPLAIVAVAARLLQRWYDSYAHRERS